MTTEHLGVRLPSGAHTAVLEQGVAGQQPSLVLVHAWGESRHAFDLVRACLPDDLHVLVPDLRGHGAADKPGTGYLLADLVPDIVGVMGRWRLDRAVLVGASSGGYLAQQVAVSQPARVAGLVLSGAPCNLHGLRPRFAEEIAALTDPIDLAWAKQFNASMMTSTDVPEGFLDLMAEDLATIPSPVLRASLAGLTDSTPPTQLGPVTAPALVVAGADDPMTTSQTPGLLAAIPQARLVTYPHTGHVVHFEQPERLAADIGAFVHGLSD